MKCPKWADPQRQKVDEWLPGVSGQEGWRVTAEEYGIFFPVMKSC